MLKFSVDKRLCSQHEVSEAIRRKNKLRLLGEGAFARVYGSKHKDYVVKVTDLDYGTVGRDMTYGFRDPYLDYLDFAALYPNNPFFPKLHDVVLFTKPVEDEQTFAVVVLERLRPLNRSNKRGMNLYSYMQDINAMLYECGDIHKRFARTDLFNKTSYMYQALSVLYDINRRWSDDLHISNVMIRADGQLVITDPVS